MEEIKKKVETKVKINGKVEIRDLEDKALITNFSFWKERLKESGVIICYCGILQRQNARRVVPLKYNNRIRSQN